MDERMQAVEMTRQELYGHMRRLARRGVETESKTTRRFLFEASATLDGHLWNTNAEIVRFEARVGWLRMLGLARPVTEDAS